MPSKTRLKKPDPQDLKLVPTGIAEKLEDPKRMTLKELGVAFAELSFLEAYCSAVRARVLALEVAGKKVPGAKLVMTQGHRRYTDADEVSERLIKLGWKRDEISPRSLLSPSQLEKLIGDDFKKIGRLVEKGPGKLTVVRADDPRPEIPL